MKEEQTITLENIHEAYERLHRKETDEIVDYAYELEQQLQAYKDKEDKLREIAPLDLAIHFHNTYERLAPSFGYKTREETKQFDINSNNGQLMVAVCETILNDTLQILNDKGME